MSIKSQNDRKTTSSLSVLLVLMLVVVGSLFLIDAGFISSPVHAMGSPPAGCDNLYGATITYMSISNGTTTVYPFSTTNATIFVHAGANPNYNLTYIIQVNPMSNSSNTNNGTYWTQTDAGLNYASTGCSPTNASEMFKVSVIVGSGLSFPAGYLVSYYFGTWTSPTVNIPIIWRIGWCDVSKGCPTITSSSSSTSSSYNSPTSSTSTSSSSSSSTSVSTLTTKSTMTILSSSTSSSSLSSSSLLSSTLVSSSSYNDTSAFNSTSTIKHLTNTTTITKTISSTTQKAQLKKNTTSTTARTSSSHINDSIVEAVTHTTSLAKTDTLKGSKSNSSPLINSTSTTSNVPVNNTSLVIGATATSIGIGIISVIGIAYRKGWIGRLS